MRKVANRETVRRHRKQRELGLRVRWGRCRPYDHRGCCRRAACGILCRKRAGASHHEIPGRYGGIQHGAGKSADLYRCGHLFPGNGIHFHGASGQNGSPGIPDRSAEVLGVWHTTLYVIRMRDFQYARNLATTGFWGRSTHYRVLACTTCFLLILYRPISTLLANSLCRPREIFLLFTLVDCDYYTFETTLCQALKRE